MIALSSDERQALEDVAADLGIPALWLNREIAFESGWRPNAKNPSSSARGLIQFMNKTARSMGYASSNDLVAKHPTRESQLRGPVLDYLRKFMPFTTEQSLYLSVFYPAARHWGLEREFPADVQTWNPGIVTVRDYVEHVRRRAGAHLHEEDADGED